MTEKKSFKDLQLKTDYCSSTEDLSRTLFVPLLSYSTSYSRAVGYFSSSILADLFEGLSGLIKNNGSIRLLIGSILSHEEMNAIRAKEISPDYLNKIKIDELIDYLDSTEDSKKGLRIFSWLIANDKINIKFAYREQGMFHIKTAIFEDENGNQISLTGSANETVSGLSKNRNIEEISIFRSWLESDFERHKYRVDTFESFWKNKIVHETFIYDYDKKFIEANPKIYSYVEKYKSIQGQKFLKELTIKDEVNFADFSEGEPYIPKMYGGINFELRLHQLNALKAWDESGRIGILELATGAGKTITALYKLVELWNEEKKLGNSLVVVVAAPYIALAEQWVDREMPLFGINSTKAWSGNNWESSFKNMITDFKIGVDKPVLEVITVVNKTLFTNTTLTNGLKFLSSQKRIKTFLIGDECHHHSSDDVVDKMPLFTYRLGLSATPFDEVNNHKNKNLMRIYGNNGIANNEDFKSVYRYTLDDALNDGILTEYEYYTHPVRLTVDEWDEYESIQNLISKLVAIQRNNSNNFDSGALDAAYGKLNRLIVGAENKMVVLKSIFKNNPDHLKKSIVYCGAFNDGENIKQVTHVRNMLMNELGIDASIFVADQDMLANNERSSVLASFKKGSIQSLVAIKILDEGIDVPAIQTAILVASGTKLREYIQRRGRILRKAPGKTISYIHDLVLYPPLGLEKTDNGDKLLKREKKRTDEFERLAINFGRKKNA